VLAVFAIVLGIVLGISVGGSLRGLGDLRLRLEWLILPLFVVQAVSRGRLLGVVGASEWSTAVWTAASCALVCAMLVNWRVPGMSLGAAAILLNLDVVLLNRGMPILISKESSPSAIAAVSEIARGTGGFYRLAAHGDLMAWLGDCIPLAIGRSVVLVSAGDVALMVGVAVVVIHGMSSGLGEQPSSSELP
jgi:hypothetical protein